MYSYTYKPEVCGQFKGIMNTCVCVCVCVCVRACVCACVRACVCGICFSVH